jgi:hypothetical protein
MKTLLTRLVRINVMFSLVAFASFLVTPAGVSCKKERRQQGGGDSAAGEVAYLRV